MIMRKIPTNVLLEETTRTLTGEGVQQFGIV